MIRLYCQYSHGGFKTFRINGEAHELLTQVVTSEDNYGFPPLADLYFNQGGAKILYRYLDSNTLSLIVKEIPGHGLDTDNRPISCAVQFIGDKEDRATMDRLAIRIANNIEKFEKAFADMFDLRGGLHFEGGKLAAIVKECETECDYIGDSKLLRVMDQNGTVLLFVPFSDNFGRNDKVTRKILTELQLPDEACDDNVFIRLAELNKMQYRLEPTVAKEKREEKKSGERSVEELMSEMEGLRAENTQLRTALAAANKELDELKKNDTRQIKAASLAGVIVCAFLLLLLITKCHLLTGIVIAILLAGFSYKTYILLKR